MILSIPDTQEALFSMCNPALEYECFTTVGRYLVLEFVDLCGETVTITFNKAGDLL